MTTVLLEPASGKVTGSHSNMPLVIIPSLISGLGTLTLAEAQSCRIYTDVGLTNELAREVVSADEIHVKVPTVSSSATLYFDYDGIRSDYAVTDTYGRNAVWSDYIIVVHQDSITDATGGANLTNTSTTFLTATPSPLGGTYGEYASANLRRADQASFRPNTITVQSWARLDTLANSTYPRVIDRWIETTNRGYRMHFSRDSGTQRLTWGITNTTFRIVDTGNIISTGVWYMAHGTYDGANVRLYVDGVQQASLATTGNISYVTGTDLRFGSNRTSPIFNLDGQLDESRIRSGALSSDWISTEYNNQDDNAAFWVATPVGGGGIILPNFLGFAGL